MTLWQQVWQWTIRALSTPNTSRAACLLLETMFKENTLDKKDVAGLLEASIFSDGLNGPSSLTDSALSFWTTMIGSKRSSNPIWAQKISSRVMSWLNATWILRKAVAYHMEVAPLTEF